MTLDPYHLTPPASLNRVRIVDLPGVNLDAEVRGKTAGELLSASALAGVLRDHAPALTLDPALDDGELCAAFFTHYAALPSDAVASVARRMGRNLGWLLITLRRGDAVNRAAREEWDGSYWAHWATVRHVWIGGGMGAGHFGAALIAHPQDLCAAQGVTDIAIQQSPYGVHLPLMGMARRAPLGCRAALVLDFGQTRVKRAVARYTDGALTALDLLPSTLLPWTSLFPAGIDPADGAHHLVAWMVKVITEAWAEAAARYDLCYAMPISLAAYMVNGQPVSAQGGVYARLTAITDHAERSFTENLRALLGVPVVVTLEHDGTAAATAHAGTPHGAVITLGTALGIGFPRPEDDDLRVVDAQFRLAR